MYGQPPRPLDIRYGTLTVQQVHRYEAAAFMVPGGDALVFMLHSRIRRDSVRGLPHANVHSDGEPPYVEVATRVIGLPLSPEERAYRHCLRLNSVEAGPTSVMTDQLKGGPLVVPCDPTMRLIVASRLEELPRWRARAPVWDDRYDLVFPNRIGAPLSAPSLSRAHQFICDVVQLPRFSLHALRDPRRTPLSN